MSLQCGSCRLPVEQLTGLGLAAEDHGSCNMSKEEIQRRLYLLHAATGHSPVRYLVQSLKKRGVHPVSSKRLSGLRVRFGGKV